MGSIYNQIIDLETHWQGFNKKPFSKNDLIELAERNNIVVLKDHSVENACVFHYDGKKVVLYNPHQPDIDFTLSLGHELGHIGLGHVHPHSSPLHANFFSNSSIEKDAGIIGFLFWAPSSDLHQMDIVGRLNLEEIYNNCKDYRYGDIDGSDIEKICKARLRIYNALKRIKN
ncbi:hypothetical protein DSLASN_05540 [Desulfoluna limicola]|uniref:IrrE N-terminal-like domain-containing protein n=1 Tax=Desulfoluna limicola TaxID=2810562 RepID=A0ABM7PCI5_9BACT|nr:ImmA/IrrE family metallo-endopeptidase [Desulfoluna limicola]BCS94922.1 hypothetical protein DSLASN_05540 [Desulfoluna limicola]